MRKSTSSHYIFQEGYLFTPSRIRAIIAALGFPVPSMGVDVVVDTASRIALGQRQIPESTIHTRKHTDTDRKEYDPYNTRDRQNNFESRRIVELGKKDHQANNSSGK